MSIQGASRHLAAGTGLDPDDLLQEARLRVLSCYSPPISTNPPDALLFTVMRHLKFDHLRSIRGLIFIPIDYSSPPFSSPYSDD
jgi:DNA-directed RNA polymerase specialized sigma24 family protein